MFPCYEHKLRWDDYGEIIRPEDWADVKAEDAKVTFITIHFVQCLQVKSESFVTILFIKLDC